MRSIKETERLKTQMKERARGRGIKTREIKKRGREEEDQMRIETSLKRAKME
ncbi:uncharacterized protein BP01DRAFT_361209 [Aspergillus saccharolyticus JOP 1030-1]|uniref:Uncharacterized protein n=1 Tax=Aspergillus saccharolyticus JOP 1030-1 TaxID=1450539 RepID=A0A318YZQ2_9EURO|nr:hypothetical protein BP01DRAFT_361209 [Aspergillus saccharolyticus JOP 1030-1]PYH40491.1 hypothetical protein BP01DRAFT_361209 [Aspergillus saccharolyticus JOP 1030-1]